MNPRDDHEAALYYARFGILDEQSEPPVDWREIESEEAREAQEEAENGAG